MTRIALATCILSVAAATLGGAVTSFYDLETRTLAGTPANLSQYRGTVSLVVNVASYCGYTPQYAGLEKAAPRAEGQRRQRPRLSEQRLRRPGARHRAGDRRLLPAHLRRHVPDVREGRDEEGTRAVA